MIEPDKMEEKTETHQKNPYKKLHPKSLSEIQNAKLSSKYKRNQQFFNKKCRNNPKLKPESINKNYIGIKILRNSTFNNENDSKRNIKVL